MPLRRVASLCDLRGHGTAEKVLPHRPPTRPRPGRVQGRPRRAVIGAFQRPCFRASGGAATGRGRERVFHDRRRSGKVIGELRLGVARVGGPEVLGSPSNALAAS